MNQHLNETHHCEVCGETALESVLNIGDHPMCDDLVQVGDARICREYPIEILFCKKCITAHQRFQIPKQELFPASYHYRSRFTADVLNGMRMLVDGCEERFGSLDSKKVLDIGCNDGSLLGFFRAKGAVTIGVEPTGAAEDAKQDGHNIFSEYFTKEVAKAVLNAHGKLDFITFTNVFAHIEDLDGVLQALKILMDDDTVLVIENHYLGAVLDGNQFDTFYHEHPRTYSFSSFAQMAKTLQAEILDVDFPSRYGGNIRVYIGRSSGSCVNSERLHDLEHRESAFASAFVSLQQNIEQWKQAKSKQIAELVNIHGKLRAKAFPGRAAILVKLLSLDDSMISAVYEKPGSLKIGNYLPGTRIPIKSDEELFAMTDLSQPIINLAWHIPNEIHNYLKKHHYSGPVIDVLSAQDFL